MKIAILMVLTVLFLTSCYGVYGSGRGRRANPNPPADCPRSENLANPVDAGSVKFIKPA